MAFSSGRTHRNLIATPLRSFRGFAAALSSASSQSLFTCFAGREQEPCWKNSGAAERASRSIAGPSSSSVDNPECCSERSCLDDNDGAGPTAQGNRVFRCHWISARTTHGASSPSRRSKQLDGVRPSFSRSGQSDGLNPLLSRSGQFDGLGPSTSRSGQFGRWSRSPLKSREFDGLGPSPPRSRQFDGLGPSSSRWGSRHYMQSSSASLGQLEMEASQGRLQVREFPRIRIWHSFRRGHMGHAHHHHPEGPDKTGKAGERILGWGLWSDTGLSVVKGGAGYFSGSTALIADAAHSVTDIALSAVTLWTSKVAHSPKDKQHPYGHGKFETVGALGISGMLLLTGGGIGWHALEALQPYIPMMSDWVQATGSHEHEHGHGGGHHHGIDLQHPYVALTAAAVSIGVKELLYQRTKQVGEAQHSELLKASAWHHRSDAISSIIALLGIGGAIAGLPLLDPVACLLVSGMIAKAGFETGYQSLQDLVDSGVKESVLSPIRNTVLQIQGVEGCHHLRGRRMGSFIHLDAHIEVDPWLSVSAAHNIAEAVSHQVRKQHPEVMETFVHIEPADGGLKTVTHAEAEGKHEFHDHSGDSHKHTEEAGDEPILSKKDLTKRGSKSDLMKAAEEEQCVDDSFESDMRQHPEVEQDVRQIVGADFHEKMSITHVTSHFVQGKVVVEVEVSMSPEISVRSAMDYANDAEQALLQKVSDISAVRVQLKLTRSPIQST